LYDYVCRATKSGDVGRRSRGLRARTSSPHVKSTGLYV